MPAKIQSAGFGEKSKEKKTAEGLPFVPFIKEDSRKKGIEHATGKKENGAQPKKRGASTHYYILHTIGRGRLFGSTSG